MALQLALDRLTDQQCMDLARRSAPYIDYIEIGTGVIKEYGMDIIRKMKSEFQDIPIVADMKTCDAGKHETRQALSAGADYTTIMGFASSQTIKESIDVAKDMNKHVIVDLLNVQSTKKVEELASLGVEHVSVHIGKDMQQGDEVSLDQFKGLTDTFYVFAAGGIKLDSIGKFSRLNPHTYIVGSYLTQSEDIRASINRLKEALGEHESHL